MRWIRGTVNAVLLVTLVKPIVRRILARQRRQAQESAAPAIAIAMQELVEAALIEELGLPAGSPQPTPEEASEELVSGRSRGTVLIVGAVVVVTVGAAVAVATSIRRRRQAQAAQKARARGSEWVAIPVDAPAEDAQEVAQAAMEEALID